jgi:general secretion pathway protein N
MTLTPNQRLPTYLLAAFAGWSLMVVIAAFAGLGSRYGLHPDDASRVPPLPQVDLSRARSPLEPIDAYAVIGERPLFNADRRPLPPPASDAPAEDAPPPPAPLDVVLTSVVMSGEFKVAIVLDTKGQRTQSVRVGSSLEGDQAGWKLVELAPRKAVFEGPTGRSELDLRVFDGTGGQPPTALATPPGQPKPEDPSSQPAAAPEGEAQTPESRAELIRKRIEERRRQMREEAERANKEQE